MTLTIVVSAVAALIVGICLGYIVFRYVIKGIYNEMLEKARKEKEKLQDGTKESIEKKSF